MYVEGSEKEKDNLYLLLAPGRRKNGKAKENLLELQKHLFQHVHNSSLLLPGWKPIKTCIYALYAFNLLCNRIERKSHSSEKVRTHLSSYLDSMCTHACIPSRTTQRKYAEESQLWKAYRMGRSGRSVWLCTLLTTCCSILVALLLSCSQPVK